MHDLIRRSEVTREFSVSSDAASPLAKAFLNSAIPLPSDFPISGIFPGPKTKRAITKMTTSSGNPRLPILTPFDSQNMFFLFSRRVSRRVSWFSAHSCAMFADMFPIISLLLQTDATWKLPEPAGSMHGRQMEFDRKTWKYLQARAGLVVARGRVRSPIRINFDAHGQKHSVLT